MTDRPILFSAPMVRALIAGTKTQTRRAMKPQPEPEFRGAWFRPDGLNLRPAMLFGGPTHKMLRRLPPPGTRLWVRESLTFDWTKNDWLYAADRAIMVDVCGGELETPRPDRWPRGVAPSIHMPRFASRLTLIVTDVRVQRLQEISKEDAIAEGCEPYEVFHDDARSGGFTDPRLMFIELWNHINGEGAWEANPWVAAYSFRVIKANIDSPEAKAT